VKNPAYEAAAKVRNATFQAVMELKPPLSLFPWTSVSNLGIKPLQKAITKMGVCASTLSPQPSTDAVSKLEKACCTFRDALKAFNSAQNLKNGQ
jgi:hypothetical protein